MNVIIQVDNSVVCIGLYFLYASSSKESRTQHNCRLPSILEGKRERFLASWNPPPSCISKKEGSDVMIRCGSSARNGLLKNGAHKEEEEEDEMKMKQR